MANNLIIFYILFIIKKVPKFWSINNKKLYLFKNQVYNIIKIIISLFYKKKY